MPDINGIPYVDSTDLVSGWPATSQSVAQEVSDQLASKVDYALPTNAQTGTTYTFVAADAEKLTTASNAAAVTLTIPPQSSVTWADNTVLRVVNYGAGAVTIDGGSGVTVTNTASTIAQYGAAVAIRTGSDAWTVVPFGGGDIPAAEVSSPAATGQYTDGSGDTWDYYTFTSSGTLTVDTAGFADVLVVGAGGGGGRSRGGGGGAGGYLSATDVYLSATTHTVRVGAGGAGGDQVSGQLPSGLTGNASGIGDYIVAPGGGGGGGNQKPGSNGGSGGGGGGGFTNGIGGAGFAPQGNDGGRGNDGTTVPAGGGGGAGAAGVDAATPSTAGDGGAGLASSITGSSVTRGGGGGGGNLGGTAGTGGSGGGGNGTTNNTTGGAGTANTGGGGGGGGIASSPGAIGGAGGSGVVIVRVKV